MLSKPRRPSFFISCAWAGALLLVAFALLGVAKNAFSGHPVPWPDVLGILRNANAGLLLGLIYATVAALMPAGSKRSAAPLVPSAMVLLILHPMFGLAELRTATLPDALFCIGWITATLLYLLVRTWQRSHSR